MKQATLRVGLPILVLALGTLGAVTMYRSKAQPERREVETLAPLVRVQRVEPVDLQLSVSSQGTVSPRTESTLVPEVAGQVIWVSPRFASGGFFEAGEPLLRIDPFDFRQAVVQARSALAQAALRLAQEKAEAEVAEHEWIDLGEGAPSSLTLREPQLAEAEASLAAANAALERAQRNLERTEILAPYAGRIRRKDVDVGQYVTPGTPLALVYAVDFAEIRLPLPDEELAFVDLPLVYRGDDGSRNAPEVVLRASFAGREHEWSGHIVRTEGEIDERSRMVHAVARVADPYGRGEDPDRPPLAAGMFVNATILGRVVEGVSVVPRSAVRGEDQVIVVDGDDRLRLRTVEIVRTTAEQVIVGSGLDEGDRVCLSPLAAVTDGMRVRIDASGS
jgi:multidrug efflux system membrane fusion protein